MEPPLAPSLLERHLEKLRIFYESAPTEPTAAGRFYRKLLAVYYRDLIPQGSSVLEIGCGAGHLLKLLPNRRVAGIDLSEKQIAAARVALPEGEFHVMAGENLVLTRTFDFVILSETANFASDVQKIHTVSHPQTRLILNFHSGLWRPLLNLCTTFGIRAQHPPCNWLSSADMTNLLRLAGWDLLKQQSRLLLAVPCFGLEKIVNRFVAPIFSQLALTVFQLARPNSMPLSDKAVSVVIPAQNEAGNIEAAVRRMPKLGKHTEIIFIEGTQPIKPGLKSSECGRLIPISISKQCARLERAKETLSVKRSKQRRAKYL